MAPFMPSPAGVRTRLAPSLEESATFNRHGLGHGQGQFITFAAQLDAGDTRIATGELDDMRAFVDFAITFAGDHRDPDAVFTLLSG